MEVISGIYKIQSIIKPERCYIGSAVHINRRRGEHLRMLRKGKHDSRKLQNHYNKYGESDLIFSILMGCDKSNLIPNEQYFIDSHNTWFNISPTAGNRLGTKCTLESCKRMSIAQQGAKSPMQDKKHKPESIKKMSDGHKGNVPWNKGKQGVQVAWNKGKKQPPISEITRAKMRISHSGEKNNMFGKHHTEESNRKNSESQMGKKRGPHSPESILKMSISKKGKKRKPFSEEARHNMSVASFIREAKKRNTINSLI